MRKPPRTSDRNYLRSHVEEVEMASEGSGYRRKWKKWLAIYLAVGAVAYFVIYLAFFAHASAGGGGFHY